MSLHHIKTLRSLHIYDEIISKLVSLHPQSFYILYESL